MGPDSSFGVLGVGAMGSALVRAWVRAGLVAPAALSLHDPDAPRATDLAAELGARGRLARGAGRHRYAPAGGQAR